MSRPTLPADGVKPWGDLLRDAIFSVSDKADTAVTLATSANTTATNALNTANTANTTASTNGTAITALQTAMGTKADDSLVVKLAGTQTITGAKTFSVAPVVPDGSFAIAKTTNLQTTLDAKALISHTHVSTSITDFVEAVQDTMAITLVDGTGAALPYNDTTGKITVAGGGGGAVTIANLPSGAVVSQANTDSARITSRTDIRVLVVGGATPPSWVIAGDLHYATA